MCVCLSGKSNAVTDGTTPVTDRTAPRGILKNTPDENATTQSADDPKRKRGGLKTNKQNDEKKEKGAAQIIIPNNLIFAGRNRIFDLSQLYKFLRI